MSILILSIILSITLMIGIFIVVLYFQHKGRLNKRAFMFVPLGLLAMLLLLSECFVTIKANEVGIVYDEFGGLQEEVKYEGFQTKSIFQHITRISTSNRTSQIKIDAQTVDSSFATFSITIIYKVEAGNAGKFYKSTNSVEISQQQLSSLVKEALQSSSIKYEIYSILGDKLEEVRVDFTENLKEIIFERYNITLISTSFDEIDAGTRIEEIIKNKAEALQQIEIAEAEKQKATIDAETKKIQAEAEAAVEKIKAEAEAEIVKIAADAEAYKVEKEKSAIIEMIDSIYQQYNSSLTYEQCSEIVLQTIFFDKWNGELPEVLTSDSLSSLIGSLINGSN